MIEPYCDSDDEVFFGPITMHEVKVIFNIRDASKKRKEEIDRCNTVSQMLDTTAAEIDGRVVGGSVTWNSEGASSTFSGGQLNTAVLASDHTEPDPELDGSGSDECGEVCYTNCDSSDSRSGELDVACLLMQESSHEEALQPRSPVLLSCHTEPRLKLDGSGRNSCGGECRVSLGSLSPHNKALDVACLLIQDSRHEEASQQNFPALSSCDYVKSGKELDKLGSNSSSSVCHVSCNSWGSCGGVLDVAGLSMQDGSSSKSPALSNFDDMDDTLFEINKLLALEDDLSPTVLSPKYSIRSEMRASPMADVVQSEANVCHKVDLVGNAPTVDTNFEDETDESSVQAEKLCSKNICDESEGLIVVEQSDSGDPVHPEKPSVSCGISSREPTSYHSDVSSSSDVLNRSVTGSRDSDASSDKENMESSTPLRRQASKAVFAPPWRPGGCAQRATPRSRFAVQSPVGMYIRSNPAPSLVQNVRPAPRRVPKGAFTPEHKKVLMEVTASASSSLPVVRYASKSAHVLVSQLQNAQKLPPSVRKLIQTPEPMVTRHQGRFRLKNLSELCKNISSSESEVSVLVQKTALKPGPPLN